MPKPDKNRKIHTPAQAGRQVSQRNTAGNASLFGILPFACNKNTKSVANARNRSAVIPFFDFRICSPPVVFRSLTLLYPFFLFLSSTGKKRPCGSSTAGAFWGRKSVLKSCLCCTNFRASDLSPVWVLYYIAWLCAISVFYDDVAACFRIYTTQVNNLSWVVIFLPLWIFQIPQMYTLTMRSSHWLGLNIPSLSLRYVFASL